jgi:hypothetical protein
MVKIYKHQLKLSKTLDLNSKVLYFIKNANLPLCIINGKERFDYLYDLYKKDIPKTYVNVEEKGLIIETQATCIHTKSEKKSEQGKKFPSHTNLISDFIKRIIQYIPDISSDIFSRINDKKCTNKTKANEVIEKFINFIEDISKDKYKEFFFSKEQKSSDKKHKTFVQKIQAYVLRKISLGLRSDKSSYFIILEDKKFNDKCIQLRWLDPVENLMINPSMVSNHQINLGRDMIKKMDKERSGPKIIKYFSKAVNTIIKMITFTTGREDISIDDFLPTMVYLFISVGPNNVISNFGNATYFMLSNEENENTGYNLANIEGCINFIKQYNEEKCKMTKEEFNENCKRSLQMNSNMGNSNGNEQQQTNQNDNQEQNKIIENNNNE